MKSSRPQNRPRVALNGIEYLLLSIQSNPGKSQRWHLKRKYMYQHGVEDYHKGGSGAGYFRSKSYRDVLWFDNASQTVRYGCSRSVNDTSGYFSSYSCTGHSSYSYKPSSSEMHLTGAGWERANRVRKKLGLDPLHSSDFVYTPV